MHPVALRQLAEALVLYDADRAPERVTVANSGVGVSRGLSLRDRGRDETALVFAIQTRLLELSGLGVADVRRVAERLVHSQDDGDGRFTILVCGSELVGAEEPAAAESRALSMRAVLIAELQRALAGDEPPVTVRRSVPASLEAR